MNTVPGRTLTQPDWLAARITEMGHSWGTTSPRIAGTLWWCMVASALVEQIARAYAQGEQAAEPLLDRFDCEVRPDGGVERIHILAGPDEPAEPGTALRETLAAVITPVAEVSGAGIPALWAIVADAVGNRALDAGSPAAGTRLATEIGGKLPIPRFVDLGGRTFVKRISCCLVFEVPNCEMCTSCPKRPAAERESLLKQLAADN
ncbi:(2Fe-2S)-binding protein [Nocardia sp. XZ_19_369]|uniref:(2Fe-2S)-binding protein n=1 Tax=Nocardia sp. XZ_19_369 TaxID=2769487 RepID=UPI0027D236D6|nr:(2Fe-2S)-binding protein [Nocardia sp. XZ_19_369]